MTYGSMLATAAVACLFITQASAQNIVGSTVVDGKAVELFEDNTWRFIGADANADTCAAVTKGVVFCGDLANWKPIRPPSNEISAAYRKDSRHYGMIIAEQIGVDAGVSETVMRDTAIGTAARAAGVALADIPVVDTYVSNSNGTDVSTVAYVATVDDLPIVYANSIHVGKQQSAQLVTYAFSESFTVSHSALHQTFLNHVKVTE